MNLNDELTRNALHEMILATNPDDLTYNDDDLDAADDAIYAAADELHDAYQLMLANPDRTELTNLALALDLCPIHLCDIDICADDMISTCAHYR